VAIAPEISAGAIALQRSLIPGTSRASGSGLVGLLGYRLDILATLSWYES